MSALKKYLAHRAAKGEKIHKEEAEDIGAEHEPSDDDIENEIRKHFGGKAKHIKKVSASEHAKMLGLDDDEY